MKNFGVLACLRLKVKITGLFFSAFQVKDKRLIEEKLNAKLPCI